MRPNRIPLSIGETKAMTEKIKCVCKQCNKVFNIYPSQERRGHGKFCSYECYAKSRKKKIKRICKICDIEFEIGLRLIKQGRGKFCSNKCQGKYQRGENSPHWQGGISFEPYCHKFNEQFKEYIRDKFGRVCFLCDKTEKENGKKLSVHHVNYNKNCGCDEDETCQFVPLCVKCNNKVNKNRKEWEAKINAMLHSKLNGWYI